MLPPVDLKGYLGLVSLPPESWGNGGMINFESGMTLQPMTEKTC